MLFDVTGEFVTYIERKLIWTNLKLETKGEENKRSKKETDKLLKEQLGLSRILAAVTMALELVMASQWEYGNRSKEVLRKDWEESFLPRGYKTCERAQELILKTEEEKQDKQKREMEKEVKATAQLTKQIHAHLGLGTLKDEADLAQRKVEVAKENKKIVAEKQKKKDVKALEAERKLQEQKMTWAQRAKETATMIPSKKPSLSLDNSTAKQQTTATAPPAERKETKIVMEVKVAYPGPGATWVGMKERLKGEVTAAFQAFNNATQDLRLPLIKDIENIDGNGFERLLTFEGTAETAEPKTVLRNLTAYFSAQDRDYFKRAWVYQPYATSLVIYGLAAKDHHLINELDIKLRIENKNLRWGERKARRMVGRAAEHGKPPVRIEFETAADAKKAMFELQLGGNPLTVKKYYDRTKVIVPGAPTGPKGETKGNKQREYKGLYENRGTSAVAYKAWSHSRGWKQAYSEEETYRRFQENEKAKGGFRGNTGNSGYTEKRWEETGSGRWTTVSGRRSQGSQGTQYHTRRATRLDGYHG